MADILGMGRRNFSCQRRTDPDGWYSDLFKPMFATYINKIQQDAAVCRYSFTAKLLYMFRVSIAPIIRST